MTHRKSRFDASAMLPAGVRRALPRAGDPAPRVKEMPQRFTLHTGATSGKHDGDDADYIDVEFEVLEDFETFMADRTRRLREATLEHARNGFLSARFICGTAPQPAQRSVLL